MSYSLQIVLAVAVASTLCVTGCFKKTEKKNSSESAEFFKEIGSLEQENAEQQTSAAMQNAAIPPNVESSAENSVPQKPSLKDIQQALKNANFYEGKIDGVSGPKTRKAIEVFQTQNNLEADGKVGPKTWEKLKMYLNTPAVGTSSSATPAAESTKGISD